MNPFDSPSGTVWHYKDPLLIADTDDIYVVYGKKFRGFRPYLNLMTGYFGLLIKDSRYNTSSTLFAEAT